jgi:hypothetical protein
MGALGSPEVDKLNVIDESGIGWDHVWATCCSVSVIGWASEDGRLTHLELSDSFFPTTDDLAGANYELQGSAAVSARVEYSAISQFACEVDLGAGARSADRASTLVRFLNTERHVVLCHICAGLLTGNLCGCPFWATPRLLFLITTTHIRINVFRPILSFPVLLFLLLCCYHPVLCFSLGLPIFLCEPMVNVKARICESIPQRLVRILLVVGCSVSKHLNLIGGKVDSIKIHGKVLLLQSISSPLLLSIYHSTGVGVISFHLYGFGWLALKYT